MRHFIEICNEYSGFASTILSAFSLMIAIVAVWISFRAQHKQAEIALFEKRVETYWGIERICNFMSKFPLSANSRNYDSLASAFLLEIGSEEDRLFEKIKKIKKQLSNPNLTEIQKKALDEKLRAEADKFVPFVIKNIKTDDEMKQRIHFLFDGDIEKRCEKLIDLFEAFVLGFTVFDDEDYKDLIDRMHAQSSEIHISTLLSDMEKQVWKR